jgi:excisionase family DNA binding protein
MNDHDTVSVVPTKLIEELIEAIQDLRSVRNPAEAMRPLSIAEAAKTLRCRRSEVEKLIANGAMPYIKRNSRRYILPSEIAQWLRNESERQLLPKGRRRPRHRLKPEDVDPALREFFE